MPVPIGTLRLILGLLCIFFAHFLGRSLGARARSGPRGSRPVIWILRTVVTAMGVAWPGIDVVALSVFSGAAMSAVLGYLAARKPPKREDLSKEIFPHQ